MPRLQLESTEDTFNLDDVLIKGTGVQALAGAAGLGLPPVSVQWLEGAGDGATFRGKRVLPRDIDLPLHFQANSREDLKVLLSRFAIMLAGECILRLIDDDGTDWSVKVHRVGGGDYAYGADTVGEKDYSTIITFRAGDPYWTYSETARQKIESTPTGNSLLPRLVNLRVTSSQAIGSMLLENLGSAPAHPVWEVNGPGRDFQATSPSGESFHWTGTLAPDEKLIVDTRLGTVVDGAGANRYAEMAPAPRFWAIPPGTSTATAMLEDTSPGTDLGGQIVGRSSITCLWRPRNWMVI